MSGDENSWLITPAFRRSVVAKIDEAIERSGMPATTRTIDMENHLFRKSQSKEEYLRFVARLILHVREMRTERGIDNMPPGAGNADGQGMWEWIENMILAHLGMQGDPMQRQMEEIDR